MNLRCKVCGEKAAGFHFGAFTCEGCKSFFGRCCNNLSIISECRNNRECIIDKKNRTSCKACRLQKCLQVGMSKSGSRYGRRSNWFKQYFQEQELIKCTDQSKCDQFDTFVSSDLCAKQVHSSLRIGYYTYFGEHTFLSSNEKSLANSEPFADEMLLTRYDGSDNPLDLSNKKKVDQDQDVITKLSSPLDLSVKDPIIF